MNLLSDLTKAITPPPGVSDNKARIFIECNPLIPGVESSLNKGAYVDLDVGNYSHGDLEKKLLNGKVVGVEPGKGLMKVELFTHPEFKSEPYVVNASNPEYCLKDAKWRNQTKAIRVVNKVEGFGEALSNFGMVDVVLVALILLAIYLIYRQ